MGLDRSLVYLFPFRMTSVGYWVLVFSSTNGACTGWERHTMLAGKYLPKTRTSFKSCLSSLDGKGKSLKS